MNTVARLVEGVFIALRLGGYRLVDRKRGVRVDACELRGVVVDVGANTTLI
jgi:hypothetical protein